MCFMVGGQGGKDEGLEEVPVGQEVVCFPGVGGRGYGFFMVRGRRRGTEGGGKGGRVCATGRPLFSENS